MAANDSFAVLMGRLRSGEDEAAREVFVRFAGRLVGLARRHLDGRLAVKVDPRTWCSRRTRASSSASGTANWRSAPGTGCGAC